MRYAFNIKIVNKILNKASSNINEFYISHKAFGFLSRFRMNKLEKTSRYVVVKKAEILLIYILLL